MPQNENAFANTSFANAQNIKSLKDLKDLDTNLADVKRKAMNEDDIHTPEDLAREIVMHPNLWGMYTIADVIHRLIKESKT